MISGSDMSNIRDLVQKHAELETKLDIEGVLGTLVDNPVYEFHPARLRLEGKENIRQFYREHFASFFPLIQSFVMINECWDMHSVCMEYDVHLKAPYDSNRAYRIMVTLSEENSRLIGERFYVENELAQLMAGTSFEKFVNF
jgi:hypothetical protein